jgi:hypothetical protein
MEQAGGPRRIELQASVGQKRGRGKKKKKRLFFLFKRV